MIQPILKKPQKRPPDTDVHGHPARVDRKRGAQIITDLYFPISHRTLEAWPITWRYVNGRATCDTGELLALAEAKLNAAPPLMGGRKAGRHLKCEHFSTL
jgi:hypothetical protein